MLAGEQVWVGSCRFQPPQAVPSPEDFWGSSAVGAQLYFGVVTTSSSPLSCVVVTGRALKAVPGPPQTPPASKDLLFLRREAEGAATSPPTP